MRRALLVALAALVVAPEASAKVCVRITTTPATPMAGKPATIRMTALSIVISNGRARPGNRQVPMPAGSVLNVRAVSPTGEWRLVRVRRSAGRPSVLEGRVTFPTAGLWTLSWSAWGDRNPECSGMTRVRVRRG